VGKQTEVCRIWKNSSRAFLSNTGWTPDWDITGAWTTKRLDKVSENLAAKVVRGDGEGEEGLDGVVVIKTRVRKIKE
jgi:hypothetical protein